MIRWFRRTAILDAAEPQSGRAASALVRELTARITTPRRAASVLARAAAFERLSATEQEAELPAVYLLCERYLVELDHEPVNRAALREEVRRRYGDLLALPAFRLIFEPADRQEVLLCKGLLRRILARASETLGAGPGQSLAQLQSWLEGRPDAPTTVPLLEERVRPTDDNEWIELLSRVSEALFRNLERALGERGAVRIYEGCYQEIFESYSGLDTFPVVVGMLPDWLLDEDKIVLLSRRQVQRVVLDKVERLQRINERLSSQNEELRRMQEMLEAARNDLEQRIEERTEELRGTNESLRREVGERLRAEEALRQSELSFRSLIEHGSDIILLTDLDGTLRYVSPSIERALGYEADGLVGADLFAFVEPGDHDQLRRRLAGMLEDVEAVRSIPTRMRHREGGWRLWEIRARPLMNHPGGPGIVLNAHDITDRHQLEARLTQAQKMEAVGRLAGGVAHDFNNLLTAIKGHVSFLLEDLPEGSEARTDAEGVREAADRAAGLTGQLLAFSRRQVFQPAVIDLNQTVGEMEKMLRRLIGEDIELEAALDERLGRVRADPTQIAQVIMNLAINARDAMPGGGSLLIETANVELDAQQLRGGARAEGGSYVLLAVTDTGTGMDESTQARIFEPFFTTKPAGRGTGLGLSTVYGIVEQSGGFVWVYSELGRGTTFKVYLPRVDAAVTAREGSDTPPEVQGTEVILLAEDDVAVRALARRVLERAGYTVLAAENGQQAIDQASRYGKPIQLLLTDVVMPGMGGRELSERLREVRPELAVLYMSGYTDDAILRQGMLDHGTAFLEKPFAPATLLRRTREVLEAAPTAPAGV